MTRGIRLLLAQGAIFTIILNYTTIFVNLYIFEKGHSISAVAWFNLVMIIFWGPAYALATWIFAKTSNRIVTRISTI